MKMSRGRGCLIALIVIAVILILGGLLAYQAFRRFANFGPTLGSGSVAGIQVPAGFETNVFAEGLDRPRFMAFGPDGDLYVADRGNGQIVALSDADGDGVADESRVFAENLDRPSSLVFREGAWYVGLPTGVVRLQDADGDGRADRQDTLVDDYPTSGSHTTRTVAFLPDGRMVVSIGSSCNVCEEEDQRRAAVVIYDGPEAAGERVFSRGLRNAVGLAVHPETGELWATNNGRDLMGDDVPPDTIEILQDGSDHGWPRCHAGEVIDPEFGQPGDCNDVTQPVAKIQAHSAPLGLTFYTGSSFPSDYRGDLFVAYHGSWNRSIPTGYKVVRLPVREGQPAGPVEDFATGWLDEESQQASGRPVGLAVGPDGALYVSDDKGGIIYRISYQGSGR